MIPRPPRRNARDDEFDRFEEEALFLILCLTVLTVINAFVIVALD